MYVDVRCVNSSSVKGLQTIIVRKFPGKNVDVGVDVICTMHRG